MSPAQRAAMEQHLETFYAFESADGRTVADWLAADLRLCLDHIAALEAVLEKIARDDAQLPSDVGNPSEYRRDMARANLPPAQAEG